MTARVIAEDLTAAVEQLRRVTRRVLRPQLRDAPLSGAEVELITTLLREPGLSVTAVAEQLGLAPNTVSTLISRSVEAGWVEREVDENDRRAARLYASRAAAERVGRWRQGRLELLHRAINGLDADDRQALVRALPALRHLMAQLDELSSSNREVHEPVSSFRRRTVDRRSPRRTRRA